MDVSQLLGWIAPNERSFEQHEAHAQAVATMGIFAIRGDWKAPPLGTKILLTDSWKHPSVVSALGFAFPGWKQYTGSCCGVGFGNAAFTLAATDVLLRGETEEIILPFWPLTYGRSRLYMGERGPGEGSFGSTIAKSAKEDGVLSFSTAGLTQFTQGDGLILGSDQSSAAKNEMAWSDGTKIPTKYLEEAHKHLIQTVAPIRSVEDLISAIANGYPCTGACMHFCNPGEARVNGDVLLGNYNGTGGHQMSYHGVYMHQKLGPLIWNQNTWGLKVYGDDPAGGPAGGVWQKASDVDRMIKSNGAEFYAYSQYQGYPSQSLNFSPW